MELKKLDLYGGLSLVSFDFDKYRIIVFSVMYLLNDSILVDRSSWMSTKKLGLKDSANPHSVELKISKLMTFLTGSNATGRVA